MPSPNRRPATPEKCGPTLAGILACLGALASEAQAIGDTVAVAALLEAIEKMQNRFILH